jgi:uncharacterized protein
MQRPESQDRPFRRPFDSRGGGGSRPFDRERGGFRRGPGGPPPSGPPVDYKALVEFVARSIADKPEDVNVIAIERGHGTLALKIKMADEDMGRLIGKAGRNIEALRTLVRVASLRERKRVFVDMWTPREERGRGRAPRREGPREQ